MTCPKCERGGTGPHPKECSVASRFWAKVEKSDGCWLWRGSTNGRYGEIRLRVGRKVYAHRMSYALNVGPVPSDKVVCHRCDVPLCVRPDHLFVGTQEDNLLDYHRKRRARAV